MYNGRLSFDVADTCSLHLVFGKANKSVTLNITFSVVLIW